MSQNYETIQSSLLRSVSVSWHGKVKKQAKIGSCSMGSKKHPSNIHSENTSFPGITEEYITQVSEELEGRVTEKHFLRNSTGQSPSSWDLCTNSTNSSWTHIYGHSAESFRDHSGTTTWKTRNRLRTVPKLIAILELSPPSVSCAIYLTWNRRRPLR